MSNLVQDEARVAEIKKLRRGKGMPWNLDSADFSVIGYSQAEFSSAFSAAIPLMPPWRTTDAIVNALGFSDHSGSLTDRRAAFARAAGVSTRTVIRWEESGINLLLDYIDRVVATKKYPVWLLNTHYFMSVWLKQNAEAMGLDPAVVENATAASYKLWNERHRLPQERQREVPDRPDPSEQRRNP